MWRMRAQRCSSKEAAFGGFRGPAARFAGPQELVELLEPPRYMHAQMAYKPRVPKAKPRDLLFS